MNKRDTKLSLSRETLHQLERALSEPELRQVAAGASIRATGCISCCTTTASCPPND
jgi:heterodisulfide reductase subunit C